MSFFKKHGQPLATDALVVGLGNPGPEYDCTRHNAGFMVASRFMKRHEMGRPRSRYSGRWCEATVLGLNVAVLLPLTYMNRSGEAVALAAHSKHIDPEKIIVVHDDMDFPFGVVRARLNGGAGGHNGLSSIADELGTSRFCRVRVGIGRPDDFDTDQRDWVLSRLDEPEERLLPVIDTAVDCVETIITDGIEDAMGRFNRRDEEGSLPDGD